MSTANVIFQAELEKIQAEAEKKTAAMIKIQADFVAAVEFIERIKRHGAPDDLEVSVIMHGPLSTTKDFDPKIYCWATCCDRHNLIDAVFDSGESLSFDATDGFYVFISPDRAPKLLIAFTKHQVATIDGIPEVIA